MDILSYLASLIQTNNGVGVPGLGTFVKKKSPGRYDAGLHAFLPPSYQLVFDPEVRETGLLAEYVGKKHNLSEASANYHIEQFVAKIKQELNDELEADVSPLGRLMLSGRLITFLPNEELNLGHQFFGLPPVVEEQPTAVAKVTPTVAPIEEYVEPEAVFSEEEVATPEAKEVVITAEPVILAEEEIVPTEAPVPAEVTPADDQEKLEAIIMENNIEEENPGLLPEEPIYVAEPEELAEEPVLEEVEVVEEPVVVETAPVDEPAIAEASVAAVTPVEETPLAEVPPVFDEPVVKEQAVVEEPPFVETPPVAEAPVVIPPFAAEEKPVVPETPVVPEKPILPIKTPETVIPLATRAAIIPEEAVNYQIEEQPKPTTPGYYKIVIGVLFLLCLAFGLYMLSPDWFRKANKETTAPEATTVPVEEKPTVVIPDSLQEQPDSLKQDAIQVDTAEVIVPPVTKTPVVNKPIATTPAKPAVVTYEVIASSVYGDKAAQQFIGSMKSKWGINAKIVSKLPGKKIKISVASFKDEKKARLERARLEEKLKIPGLYIYTNTNKPD